jgi:membrane protein
MKWRLYWETLKDAGTGWVDDKAQRMGAALAYYSAFSLAPLLLIATGIAGMVFGEQAARGEILHQVADLVGPSAAQALEEILKNSADQGALATVVGLAVLLFGASGVFVELQDSLNTIWKVPPPPGLGVWAWIRDRLLSFTLVVSTGFLLLVSLVLSAGLSALGGMLAPLTNGLPGGVWVWQLANIGLSFALITVLFAVLYKVLPAAPVAWGDVWLGGALAALLFTLGKYLIGLYLGRGSVTSALGAAGSGVVMLVWVYYSTQILFFGAEFTRAWALKAGSCCPDRTRAGNKPVAAPPGKQAAPHPAAR